METLQLRPQMNTTILQPFPNIHDSYYDIIKIWGPAVLVLPFFDWLEWSVIAGIALPVEDRKPCPLNFPSIGQTHLCVRVLLELSERQRDSVSNKL